MPPEGRPGYLFHLLSGTNDVQAVKTAAAFQEELELSTERQVKFISSNGRRVISRPIYMLLHNYNVLIGY